MFNFFLYNVIDITSNSDSAHGYRMNHVWFQFLKFSTEFLIPDVLAECSVPLIFTIAYYFLFSAII